MYRNLIYNSSLLVEYKGMYESTNTFAGGHRNQRVSLEKIKNLVKWSRFPIHKITGRNVIEIMVREPELLILALRGLEKYKEQNLFIVVHVSNQKMASYLATRKLPIDMIVIEDAYTEIISTEMYPNQFSKTKKFKAIDLTQVTFEELERIRHYFTGEIRTGVFVRQDFKKRYRIFTENDILNIPEFASPQVYVDLGPGSLCWCPYEALRNVFLNANSVLSSIENITADQYPLIDVYLVDLLNEVGYIPMVMIKGLIGEMYEEICSC